MLSDLDLPALGEYRSGHRDPEGFDAFWDRTLTAARALGDGLTLAPVRTELRTVDVFDAEFPGFGGHPVRGWLRLPKDRGAAALPAVVQYHGYGSGRGGPYDDLVWASAGYAHLIMDARGQGGAHAGGATADPEGSGPAHPGFLTRGIESPETYYYRRVFTDAVRAVDAVRLLDCVDERRVAVWGNSQGGGIALAAAGLLPDLSAGYFQAPFLTDIRRAVRITATPPYNEITGYLAARRSRVEGVFHTLDHFDGVAFARRATGPGHFSTGLTDDVCPPSTAFGAYHAYKGPKTIRAWEFNGHEAGGHEDIAEALSAFRAATARGEQER